MTIPICDKCGGKEFETVCTTPLPEEREVKASEYVKEIGSSMRKGVPAIYHYSTYKMTCKRCGAEYKYTI